MSRAAIVAICFLLAACDLAARDRYEHEYKMECLKQHGTIGSWTGNCELNP